MKEEIIMKELIDIRSRGNVFGEAEIAGIDKEGL